MRRKKHDPSLSGWLKVIVGLAVVAIATTAEAGNVSTAPALRPTTTCVQLRVLLP